MLFGKKTTVTVMFILFMVVIVFTFNNKVLAAINNEPSFSQKQEINMELYKKRNIINMSPEQFANEIGNVYPDIQSYFDEDSRLVDADKIIGFSEAFKEQKDLKKNIIFNGIAGEALPVNDIDNASYKVIDVICNEYKDDANNRLFAQELHIGIIGEKHTDESPVIAEVKIIFFWIMAIIWREAVLFKVCKTRQGQYYLMLRPFNFRDCSS